MADVKIKIDIDADTAAIERVRAQLKSLCREVDDCTDTHQKHTRTLRDLSREQKRGGDEDDKRSRKFGALGKMGKMLTKVLRTLGKFGFLYMAIEAAAAVLVIGSAALAFKTGAFLAKAYQQALAGVAYGFAAVTAAAAAALAAQRQFQSVQMAPQYFEGGANTDDRFKGSSGAMKMLVDDISLAVIGAQGLQSAFTTLSKQGPVTGQTVGVLRELSNYTTGIGGDIAKNTESLAQFLAEFQKKGRMSQSVKDLGAELGPDFTKILNDVTKMGISTFDQFASAAASGQLGETFATKYKGQLNAINSTVVGQFKMGLATIKAELMEIGEPMLAPLSVAIQRISRSFEALFIRIRGNVVEIGSGSLLDGLVNAIEKVNIMIGRLVSRDIGRAGEMLDYLKRGWEAVARFFERIQDYLRPLQATATLLGEVLGRVLKLVGESFNNSVQALNDSLGDTSHSFDNFGNAVVGFVESFLEIVNFLRTQFIRVLPALVNLMTSVAGLVALLRPGLEGLIGILKTLVNLLSVGIRLFTAALTPIVEIVSAIDSLFNRILEPINDITGGLIDLNNIGQTLIATFIALKVAAYAAAASMALSGGKGGAIKTLLAQFAGRGGLAKGTQAIGGKVAGAKSASMLKNVTAAGATRALGAAGIAYAGNQAINFTSSKFRDDSVKSRTGSAVTGAAIGATAGAAIGSIVPVVGTAAGAIIGGIVGGIKGYFSAGKERRKIREAANELVKNFQSGIDEAIANGDIDALQETRAAAFNQYNMMMQAGGYSASTVAKKRKELEALNKQVDNYVQNAGNFEFFSGMDADKMNEALLKMYGTQEAAQKAAVDGVINVFELMKVLGIDVAKAYKTMIDDTNQSLVQQRLSMFDNQLQAIETQKAVNAAQRKILEEDTSTEAVTDFLKKAYEFALGETGGDALAATEFMRKHLDNAYGPGGSLESVAGLIKEGANKLKLFDAETLINQIIQTGQLQAQGRAIESIAGAAGMNIDSGTAELQLRALLGTSDNPAATMNQLNRLIEGGVTGRLTAEQMVTALFGGQAGLTGGLNILAAQDNAAIAGNAGPGAWDAMVNAMVGGGSPGSATIPPMNMRSVQIGNITVQVSGFIKDDKVADTIARQLIEKMNQHEQRATGSSGRSPVEGGGGAR